MLTTSRITCIAENIAGLIKQPFHDSGILIADELRAIRCEEDFQRLKAIFGLMRINKYTPFKDLNQWLKLELDEEDYKKLSEKFNIDQA